jgi:hypothetical protein
VGPAAEIDELALPVEGERGVGGEARLDVLGLERLVEPADDLDGLRPRHLHPLEGLVGGDDPPHLLLDGRQVVVGDRPRGPHVVVEAVARGGAEGQLDAREEPHHGPGHDVGRGMPHHRQGPDVAGEERLDGHGVRGGQRHVEAHRPAVEEGRDRPGLLPRCGLRRGGCGDDLGQTGGGGIVADGTIGKADGGHGGAGMRRRGNADGSRGHFPPKTAAYPPRRGGSKAKCPRARRRAKIA